MQTCHAQLEILQWVMPVHLKRWQYNDPTKTFHKVNDLIGFPAAYTPIANGTYNLRSTVLHKGQARLGHNEAYAREDRHGWLHYDDAATLARVDEHVVVGRCADLLFYERD